MMPSVEAQFLSLAISVFAGLAMGLLFDMYRTINFFTRPSKFFLYFLDLLFWLVTVGVVFYILLDADYAELRIYTFMGMSLGLFTYFKLFSEYVLKSYRLIVHTIMKVIRLFVVFIGLPFKLLRSLLWAPATFIKKEFLKLVKRLAGCFFSIFRPSMKKRK